MNRRDFMKTTGAASAAATLPNISLGKAPIMPLLATPKTVDELYNAINSLFKNEGEFNKAYIKSRKNGWERHVIFKTFVPGCQQPEGFEAEIDSYYNNPVDPVKKI